jgi:hypothetical protein
MKTPEELAEEFVNQEDTGSDTFAHGLRNGFLAGYRAASELNSSNNSNGWISVKDRLPEADELVICFGRAFCQNGPSVEQGRYNKWGQWQNCEWDGCGGYEYFDEVTHWMPLPKPPEKES